MKDPLKTKGARLSMELTIAGRYMVYASYRRGRGRLRRLEDRERERLRLRNLKARTSAAAEPSSAQQPTVPSEKTSSVSFCTYTSSMRC